MLKLGVDDPIPLALLVSPSYVVNQTTPFPELDPSLCNGRDKCWDTVSGSNRNLNQFVTGQKLGIALRQSKQKSFKMKFLS